jgi:hypothetical protein
MARVLSPLLSTSKAVGGVVSAMPREAAKLKVKRIELNFIFIDFGKVHFNAD